MKNIIFVGLGGFLGAVLRFYLSSLFFKFPYRSLIVNLIGSFILGFSIYISEYFPIPSEYKYFVIAGFCGALTTFSTFSFETFEFIEYSQYLNAILNIILNVIGCLIMIYLGRASALFLSKVI